MGGVMRVLPGDLVSVTAGAIIDDWCGPCEVLAHARFPVALPDAAHLTMLRGESAWVACFLSLDACAGEALPRRNVCLDRGQNFSFDPSRCRMRLDVDRPEVRDHAARWLARHHGLTVGATAPRWFRSEPYWVLCAGPQEEDGEEWDGELDFGPSPSGGGPDRRLRGDVTDPAEALALACLAAGGRS